MLLFSLWALAGEHKGQKEPLGFRKALPQSQAHSGDPSAAWGERGTQGFVGHSLMFWGCEQSGLESAGSAATVPVQLEEGEWLPAPDA